VSAAEHQHETSTLLGGGLLSERLRGADGYAHAPEFEEDLERTPGADVSLAAATQVEIESGHVRFLVPFNGGWPGEYWLRAFRQASRMWPSHLVEPMLDEGRGVQMGPLPTGALEEHVRAVKELVAAANRVYDEEIEPELRRQREEALRREREELRLQAEVESTLKNLLG
jgi:hypothetical protein